MRKKKKNTLVETHLENALTRMFHKNDVIDPQEGAEYVCPTCDQLVKPCEKHFDETCHLMVKGNTEVDLLEKEGSKRLKLVEVVCLECGNAILEKELAKNPLVEVCSSCQNRTIHRGKNR